MNTFTDNNGMKYLQHPYLLHLWIKEDGSEIWTSKAFNGIGEQFIDMEEPYKPMRPRKDRNGYFRISTYIGGKTRILRLSRLCWEAFNQSEIPKGLVIDHINHNIEDNRRCNLRLASREENVRNRISSNKKRLHKVGKGVIEFTGIWARKRSEKNFQAQIVVNKKPIYLGCFRTAEEAQAAYDAACLKYHRSFALTNQQIKYLGLQ